MKHIQAGWLVSSLFLSALWGYAAEFARGADVGWLSEMEDDGYAFYDDSGNSADVLQILKDHSINSIRYRVWVNPTDGYCNKEDVIQQAVRADSMGFWIMIDFHYSDTWADPGKQYVPAAWTDTSIGALTKNVYNYTREVLNALDSANVTPEWVQV
ncbi:MAG TPA: glycosyl hydrolase 53 family protein, partial [Fibrobacteraceae bacterium]|nr:glycosyl hydrolase 53 family protein [Fibrobacteraceae bacterium]